MKTTIEHMLNEINKYKNTDKEDILLEAINTRLDKSFQSYQSELAQGIEYLARRNELNVIRKMRKT